MRKADPAWAHGIAIGGRGGEKKKIKCRYCCKILSGSITILKQHLAKIEGNVVPCPSVPQAVFDIYRAIFVECPAHVDNLTVMKMIRTAPTVPQNSNHHEQSTNTKTESPITGRSDSPIVGPLSNTDSDFDTPNMTKIAFKGLCSEEVVLKAYPQYETISCDNFKEVFQAVEYLRADKAIIPVENSLGGSFAEIYDLLYSHSLLIVREISFIMNFCLLATPGVKIEKLKVIIGHPWTLDQCADFVDNLGIKKQSETDESFSAQLVGSTKLQDTGVIATARAAEKFGLNILAQGIQGENGSITRFWVLARDFVPPTMNNYFKTTILFSLEKGFEELGKALLVFKTYNIKVKKVDNMPQRKKQKLAEDSSTETGSFFQYVFYVDIETSTKELPTQLALDDLKGQAKFFRILGSYPVTEVSRRISN